MLEHLCNVPITSSSVDHFHWALPPPAAVWDSCPRWPCLASLFGQFSFTYLSTECSNAKRSQKRQASGLRRRNQLEAFCQNKQQHKLWSNATAEMQRLAKQLRAHSGGSHSTFRLPHNSSWDPLMRGVKPHGIRLVRTKTPTNQSRGIQQGYTVCFIREGLWHC